MIHVRASLSFYKMKNVFIVGFLLVTIKGYSQLPSISPEQLLQDHQILVTALEELHPGIYRYQTREEFKQQENRIRKQLNRSMTVEDFYRLEMPLVAALRCGHTKWHKKDNPDDRFPFRQDKLFPLRLYFKDNRAFVLQDLSGNTFLQPGTEIMEINGKKIPAIMLMLKKYISVDGTGESAFYAELNQMFNGYYATFIENSETYRVRYKSSTGRGETQLRGISLTDLRKVLDRTKPVARPPMELSIPDTGIAVLRIDRFYPGKGDIDFYKFIDSVFLAIKKRAISRLIIDLRNNEGGVEEYGGYLYSYLSKAPFTYYKKIKVARNKESSIKQYAGFPAGYEQALGLIQEKNGEFLWPVQEYLSEKPAKPNAFTGKVLILTNGFSLSVTAEFAAAVKTAGRAVFVGEETGGAYEGNNSGVFSIVSLPNTQLAVSIPLMAFYTNINQRNPASRGVQPDIKVVATVQQVLDGRDVVMEAAMAEARK